MRAKAEIDDLLGGAIGPGGVPGVAATVAVGDEVVYEAAFGERVSAATLSETLEKDLLAPLGMTSTSFRLSPSQRERLASVHAHGPDGSLAPMDPENPQEPEFI